MKAHLGHADVQSYALDRIDRALRQYAPGSIEFVSEREADVVVLPVIGRRDQAEWRAQDIRGRGQQYAVIQCCLKSTKTPAFGEWMGLWSAAALVWSYYDLRALQEAEGLGWLRIAEMYHAPLGSEAGVFRWSDGPRSWLAATSGGGWTTESVREVAMAAAGRGRVFHLGASLGRPEIAEYYTGISDKALARLYQSVRWVSGLRRIEGFELPALEGLLCGARPILFDQPHYTQWYGEHGVYIPERDRPGVIESLRELFAKPPKPVSRAERDRIAKAFAWEPIVRGFWERLGA